MTHSRVALRLAAGAAMILTLCLVGSSALAAKPLKEPFFYGPGFGPVLDSSYNPIQCGEAIVHSAWIMYGTTTTFYDDAGEVARVKIHARVEETWSLVPGAGKELRGKASYNVFTLEPGQYPYQGPEKWTGLLWHVVAPGVGTVLLDVGLEIVSWETFPPTVEVRHGQHQWLDGDFDELCEALQ